MHYVLSAYRGVEIRTTRVSTASQGLHMADALIAGGYTISAVLDENGLKVGLPELVAQADAEALQEPEGGRDT